MFFIYKNSLHIKIALLFELNFVKLFPSYLPYLFLYIHINYVKLSIMYIVKYIHLSLNFHRLTYKVNNYYVE